MKLNYSLSLTILLIVIVFITGCVSQTSDRPNATVQPFKTPNESSESAYPVSKGQFASFPPSDSPEVVSCLKQALGEEVFNAIANRQHRPSATDEVLIGNCMQQIGGQQPRLQQQDQSPPIIKNLGVSFEPWDKNTSRAGAFIFKQSEPPWGRKVFLEFGARVPDGKGGTKILPHFTYLTAPDAEVYAVADGIIIEARYQESTKDYEITIKSEPFSAWVISLDHVTDLKVSEGQTVKAGDIIGKVGPWINRLGLVEIMIFREAGIRPNVTTYNYCPFKYFDPLLLQAYQEKVAKHMKDWEDFKGDTRIYDEEKDIYPGCQYEMLIEEIET